MAIDYSLSKKAFGIIQNAQAFRKKILENSGREMNKAEESQYTGMMLEADGLIKEFNATLPKHFEPLARYLEIGDAVDPRNLNAMETYWLGQFAKGQGHNGAAGGCMVSEGSAEGLSRGPAKQKDYRSMFGLNEALDKGGFKSLNEFMSLVHSGLNDPRLRTAFAGAGIYSDPSGGFMVPEQMAAMLLDASLEGEIVRPRATVWPMASDTRKAPAWDGSDHTSNLFGGLVGKWMAEAGTGELQKPKTKQIKFDAKKLAIFASASNELLADGADFEVQLGNAISMAIGWFLDLAFLSGSGVGQPLGILNDPALVVVSKEVGQAAGTINGTNISKMFARLHPSCAANAIWICNQMLIPQLLSIHLQGTNSDFPLVTQSGGKFYMLTREIIFTEKVPAAGSQGDITLTDLSQYHIGMRKEMSLEKSNAPGWSTDETYFRNIMRVDGVGAWSKAVTPKNGDTLSWAVTLEARA